VKQSDCIGHNTGEAVRRFLALLSVRYDMAGAIVYGSRAQGTHRPDSDVDVAVLLKGDHLKGVSSDRSSGVVLVSIHVRQEVMP
jgi:predicted nucleotidyltransferase